MGLFQWLPTGKTTTRPAARPAFKPGFETLGDRITPHGGGFLGGSPFAAPWELFGSLSGLSSTSASTAGTDTVQVATELSVLSRSEGYAGTEMLVTVVVRDADGRPVRDYAGTVALTSSDAAAVLPDAYTFTADDRGRHTFRVTLNATGDQTITATSSDGAVTGDTSVSVSDAPVATSLFVQVERNVYTGSVTRVLVAALDESNRIVRGYTGTVSLTSTDATATLPDTYTFTAADRGVKVLEFTPGTSGEQTITATDGGGVSGTVTVTAEDAPVATRLVVLARPVAGSGGTVQFFVAAVDANDHLVPTYTGTVSVTSSDTAATLPDAYTFTADDRGVKRLSATLSTTGSQTISVTDGAGLTGSATVEVIDSTSTSGGGLFGGGFFGGGRGRGRR